MPLVGYPHLQQRGGSDCEYGCGWVSGPLRVHLHLKFNLNDTLSQWIDVFAVLQCLNNAALNGGTGTCDALSVYPENVTISFHNL